MQTLTGRDSWLLPTLAYPQGMYMNECSADFRRRYRIMFWEIEDMVTGISRGVFFYV